MNKIIYILCLGLIIIGCNDEILDINDNPNLAPTGDLDLLLTSAEVAAGFHTSRTVNDVAMVVSNQAYTLGFGQYNVSPDNINNDWNGLYTEALKEFEQVIVQGEVEGRPGAVGIAKVFKAYLYSIMVDMWGNIPYFEALNGETNITPNFDDGEAIYSDLLSLLDEAKVNLDSAIANAEIPPSGDIIYGGSFTRYKSLANTVKLRMLVNLRLVDPTLAVSEIQELINENDFIDTNTENFVFRFGTGIAPLNQHPLFQQDYTGTGDGKAFYMNNYFMYKMFLKEDPRLRYYILRQARFSALDFQTTPCATRTDCTYADLIVAAIQNGEEGAEGLIGRDIGDPSGIPGDGTLRATWGVYPVGGIFDGGNFPVANLNNGTNSGGSGGGIMPWLTSANTHFLLAEALLTLPSLTSPLTVREHLEAGLNDSFNFVSTISNSINSSAPATIDAAGYIQNRLDDFDAASGNGLLNIVIEEKFFAGFGNGWDSYTDMRRTGMPFDSPSSIVPVGPFPNRMPLSRSELTTNPNAPSPAPLVSERVFWDIN